MEYLRAIAMWPVEAVDLARAGHYMPLAAGLAAGYYYGGNPLQAMELGGGVQQLAMQYAVAGLASVAVEELQGLSPADPIKKPAKGGGGSAMY